MIRWPHKVSFSGLCWVDNRLSGFFIGLRMELNFCAVLASIQNATFLQSQNLHLPYSYRDHTLESDGICICSGYLPKNLYNLNSAYGSEVELRSLLQHMKKSGLKPMADIVINHRVGSTRGKGDLYNRYDGLPMPWDEYAVSSDTGGLVLYIYF